MQSIASLTAPENYEPRNYKDEALGARDRAMLSPTYRNDHIQNFMRMNFNQYLFNKNYSNETIRKYVQEVNQFEQFLESDISQATYNEIMDYMRHVQKSVSNKTAEKKLAALKNYFDYLIQVGENDHNPATQSKKPESNPIFCDYEMDSKHQFTRSPIPSRS